MRIRGGLECRNGMTAEILADAQQPKFANLASYCEDDSSDGEYKQAVD